MSLIKLPEQGMRVEKFIKTAVQNIVLMSVSLLVTLLVIEVMLRFMPVNDGFNFVPVNQEQPVFHAKPDQSVTSSMSWDFFNAREIRVNNEGFRNDQDYMTESETPLIAVIGDSYVEAVQVDYGDTFYGRFAGTLQDKARVYSFGFSGAPLSQYLIWARHAAEKYEADYLTFVIISNDFDESLGWWKRSDGFYQYEHCGTEEAKEYCLGRQDYKIGWSRPIINASALARYMVYNLQVLQAGKKLKARGSAQDYVGNAPATVDEKRLADSKLAVNLFFRDLPTYTGLPVDKINFVVDGRPYDMDEDEFKNSFFGQMRLYFIGAAVDKGYRVIDMKPAFSEDYAAHGERFEGTRDGHWNERGHAVVADRLTAFYEGALD